MALREREKAAVGLRRQVRQDEIAVFFRLKRVELLDGARQLLVVADAAPDQVDGIKQRPIEGVSMAYTFDSANANAP